MNSEFDVITTRWWLIRHAPVINAAEKRLSGQNDVPADVSDGERFACVAGRLPSGAVWITSHLQRTRQTAQALQDAGAEKAEPLAEPGFAEQAFGAWTGLTWAEIGDLGAEAQAFWDAPAAVQPPPDDDFASESFTDVCVRVAEKLEELTEQYAGRDIVCVAHAGSIRAAIAHALGVSPENALALEVQNTHLTRIDHVTTGLRAQRGGSWRVVGFNMI